MINIFTARLLAKHGDRSTLTLSVCLSVCPLQKQTYADAVFTKL